MKMIKISEQEYERIKEAVKKNKNKRVDKKLQVLIMRHENKGNEEISARTGYNARYITTLMGQYKKQGLEEFMRNKYTSHNHALTEEQEQAILAEFEEAAEAGQAVTAQEIKARFDEVRGKDTGRGYIYMLLKRHGWRKVSPRSRHPKAADEEACEASKKLSKA